jgi:sulfide:quinone oxidoreductase
VFGAHQIGFVHGEATAIDPATQKVTTSAGSYEYDYLVLATGYSNNFDVVPGLGPDGYAYDHHPGRCRAGRPGVAKVPR